MFDVCVSPGKTRRLFFPVIRLDQSYLLNHDGTKNNATIKETARLMINYRCKSCRLSRIFSSRKKMITSAPIVVRVAANTDRKALRLRRCRMWSVMDNGAVYHQIQRDSDTRQRIKLHLKSEEVVEDKCHRYIYSQAGNYQKKIFQLTK